MEKEKRKMTKEQITLQQAKIQSLIDRNEKAIADQERKGKLSSYDRRIAKRKRLLYWKRVFE